MVQKKKTKTQKSTPKKKRTISASQSVKKNDVRLSDMVDLAAEEFVKAIEIMAKLSSGNRTKLKNSIKAAAKNILKN